jgi:hypothetical protein
MLNTSHITSSFAARSRVEALESWREAESLVRIRWQAFLEAGSKGRSSAFAAYVAALDAEEAAATEMALLSFDVAA